MIKIGEPKHCAAELEFALFRDHAGGLQCRSTELTHDFGLIVPVNSACIGDLTLVILKGWRKKPLSELPGKRKYVASSRDGPLYVKLS